MIYTDKASIEIKAGDILKWDEERGPDYGRSIHEVIEIDGVLFCVMRVGYPAWTLFDDDEPIELKHFGFGSSTECRQAEIVGNINGDRSALSIERAWEYWPDERREAG